MSPVAFLNSSVVSALNNCFEKFSAAWPTLASLRYATYLDPNTCDKLCYMSCIYLTTCKILVLFWTLLIGLVSC